MSTIAVFGGSFDPPGLHHRRIVEEVRKHFDSVVVVPCGPRPDKQLDIEPIHRAALADLTFGEYIRLLEDPKKWEKIRLGVDRKVFVEELQRVLKIRNDVMHFDPDGLPPSDLSVLQQVARFLQQLFELGGNWTEAK